jgi:PIN domain nuclease of toxin-antitoxin system
MAPKLLLDTHAALWFGAGSRKLPPRVRDRVARQGAYVSVLSSIEVVLKSRRYKLPFEVGDLVKAGLEFLPLQFGVHEHLLRLPPAHGDPFDRLLIAQALQHDLVLVTCDGRLSEYPITTFWG